MYFALSKLIINEGWESAETVLNTDAVQCMFVDLSDGAVGVNAVPFLAFPENDLVKERSRELETA